MDATPRLLRDLRRWENGPAAWWTDLDPGDRPAFFRLLDIAADLPRLAGNPTVTSLEPEVWPQLAEVSADLRKLQRLVDEPVVPDGASIVTARRDIDRAAAELEDAHSVTLDALLEADEQDRLDALVEDLKTRRSGTWGQLERSQAPEIFEIFEGVLGSERFRRLTGFVLERDPFSLTLSLQDLDSKGIGWHRDLYWPREWVGQDVFAVLYGLDSDSPAKGGAFVTYVAHRNEVRAVYRRHHQATILWNGRERLGRPLHAVSGYRTDDTSRHLVILQCLRRER